MLIFDSFPDKKSAENFATTVAAIFNGLKGSVYDSQDKSNRVDPFPFVLNPPIVLITRPEYKDIDLEYNVERFIEKLVIKFDGEFAGT